MFVPYVQAPPRQRMTVLVRPAGDRTACLRSVQEVLKVFDSRLRPRVTTGETWVSAALARERFLASVALILSVLASCLACAGLYAAVASATAQRKGEIALRMALGASRAGIVSVILDDPLRTTLAGIVTGGAAAALLTRVAGSFLFGVPLVDLPAIALCGLLLVVVALLAAIGPALRAADVDPASALRSV
jgi:ABC-type antimicrobial peptide transport system permease subunit